MRVDEMIYEEIAEAYKYAKDSPSLTREGCLSCIIVRASDYEWGTTLRDAEVRILKRKYVEALRDKTRGTVELLAEIRLVCEP